ncbi:MAG TPA: TetR/AcrR family transcriptional regulator [Azospirillaceae bacterium]|nr:TetR/AcrR family transcriptional regulator [Azospirillaceae bacterium]
MTNMPIPVPEGGSDNRPGNRREQLMAIAAQLFAARGYEATSMRDIAQAVGMLPGSVYYHFPSKEELFVAAHAAGVAAVAAAVQAAIQGISDPWERLAVGAAAHLEVLLGEGSFVSILTPEFPQDLAGVRDRLVAQRAEYETVFREMVDALDPAPGIDKTIFRLTLLGALNWTRTWYRPGRMSPAEIARDMVAALRPKG